MTDNQTISWIFLSTAIASQKEPVDFDSISNVADGINHAIPSQKELQDSFKWLTQHGLVVMIGNKYSLTEKGELVYEESSKNTQTVFKIWENAENIFAKYV